MTSQVAATDDRRDEDGVRLPAGEVHGWYRGQNQTVCGLSRSRSPTFAGLTWPDVQPPSGEPPVPSGTRRAAGLPGGRSRGR